MKEEKNKNKMTEKERIDTLKIISSIHRMEADRRSKTAWRVFYTTLGVFAAGVTAKFSVGYLIPEVTEYKWWILGCAIILVIITLVFIYFVQRVNEANKRLAHAAENKIMDILAEPTINKTVMKLPKFASLYWSFGWQLSILVIFAAICSCLILFVKK